MKHFITFQKRKGLFLLPGDSVNPTLADAIVMELMKNGYRPTQELHETLKTQSKEILTEVYNDLCQGISRVTGGNGYEPIYRNFPQSVVAMSYCEFVINALIHYWTCGQWRPEDEGHLQREFAIEPIKYKEVGLLNAMQFNSIFTDIIYSGDSISAWDKEIVDWFISTQTPEFELSAIKFKETLAYVGKRLMDGDNPLPIKSATAVLRIWAAYSNGDEGLKENTKFKNPSSKQRRILLSTLDGCYDLEESFKTYREPWLRVLFYLNPATKAHTAKYPNVSLFATTLRNNPGMLKTFNSRLESMLASKDLGIFAVLKKRKGVFMRRLDHLVRIFGMQAVTEFLDTNPNLEQLITIYNHFADRGSAKERAAILASQSKSTLTTYGALEALPEKLVNDIRSCVLTAIRARTRKKKVFIDRTLYYRPIAQNNRASSVSLTSKAIGSVERIDDDAKTIRAYVHWHGRNDIDLSAMIITSDNDVIKVGWNGGHHNSGAVVYSGDNTGHSSRNAEYIDINVEKMPDNWEWIILDANVFRGDTFKGWRPSWGVYAGWMLRQRPEQNAHWLPETIDHAIKLQSDAKSAYLLAIHAPSKNVVFLDMDNRSSRITTPEDALKFRIFLDKFVVLDTGSTEISWTKIAQGHILNVLAQEVVDTPDTAEVVFDENTTWEQVSRILSEETL